MPDISFGQSRGCPSRVLDPSGPVLYQNLMSNDNQAADRGDPVAATETPVDVARRLLRCQDRGTLSTLAIADERGLGGWPYGSLVLVALAADRTPLLMLSDLAQHTRNLKADSRVSLLIDGTAGLDDPLTGARVTMLGTAAPSNAAADRQCFLDRHANAADYSGFADFRLYRITPRAAHLVAGFGRIHWIDGAALLDAGS
jgi:putative heme iron utilization protein